MGFFSDLAMGFGLQKPTKDFAARTAATIARNENKSVSESKTAQTYMDKKGVTQADTGNQELLGSTSKSNTTSKDTTVDVSVKPKSRPRLDRPPPIENKKNVAPKSVGSKATTGKKKVTVKANDSLSKIAAENNTSVAAIAAENKKITNVNSIDVGDELVIPTNTGEDVYAAGIGASGSGDVTRNADGSISVATGTKTEFRPSDDPMSVSAVDPVETTVTTEYKPGTLTESATTAGTATTASAVKGAVTAPVGDKKPNALGYGYYNKQNVWIPPDIDMQDGGGPGIAGAVFGSAGGLEADTNNDGYVTREEAEAAAEKGIFKYGIGSLSNAVGATPFGSGEAPTGVAGVVAGGGILGSLMGNEYEPRDKMFGEDGLSMTQEQVDAYMADVQQRRDQAVIDQQEKINESDDGPTEVVAVEDVKGPEDPCPDGYKFDTEKGQCVIDPFQTPFPDAPTAPISPIATLPGTVSVSGLSPYTQMAPVSLSQLQPSRVAGANPLAMQQAQMQQMPQQGLGTLSPAINRVS